jgi:proteasome lid subunit RPN8/RPN11
MPVRVPRSIFDETFARLRSCGGGRRECQSLWVGPWSAIGRISRLVHPAHTASAVGFQLDPAWLNAFWNDLADSDEGVRVQIHTHPGAAYHSSIDDAFPMLTTPGFLSLVIPRFATGPVGFADSFLAQLGDDMRWREVPIADHLEIE